MEKYLNLISYSGGKYPHLKWLINNLPAGNYHFIDIMCGSANVALNVDYPHITINDVYDEVINLFSVLRNDYDEFVRALYFTPFSRMEFDHIIDDARKGIRVSEVEKARRFFLRSQISFGANGGQKNQKGLGFEWALQKGNYYRVKNWDIKIRRLAKIVDKLRFMQIEHRDALDLFDDVNIQGNIVYFDPPYLVSTRSPKRYSHEVDIDFHIRMADKLKYSRCFVAVSGYDNPLYNDLFKSFNKITGNVNKSNVKKIEVSECLWTNYNLDAINGDLKLKFNEHR